MTIEFAERRTWSATDLILYLVGVAGLATALTILWLGMRAVMDVGGYCAEGGPYVIDVNCPDGVALLIPLSIFLGLGSAALAGIKGIALGGGWGSIVLLAWPVLFISLGWNFLDYAFNPPGDEGGIVWGWLIPGLLFVAMGAFPLLAFLPGRGGSMRSTRTGRAAGHEDVGVYDAAAEGEARYANELRRQRGRLLSDLVQRANRKSNPGAAGPGGGADTTGGAAPADESEDLVSRLERLSALYRSGSLTYDEYQRAKAAVIGEGAG